MKQKNLSANNFDSVAWCYDALAWMVFGNKLKASQKILLEQLREGDKVLIIGGGTGWILQEILKTTEVVQIDYLEVSEKMIRQAKRFVPVQNHTKINFIHGTERDLVGKDHYDCVIAFYFFDLFLPERLNPMIRIIESVLKPAGRLLVADFYLSENSPFLHRLLMKMMYLFFRKTCKVEARTLPPFRTLLREKFSPPCYSVSFFNSFMLSEVYRTIPPGVQEDRQN